MMRLRLTTTTTKTAKRLRYLLSSRISTKTNPKSSSSASPSSFSTVPNVGDAPFPLRLIYTYRSPAVVLRHTNGSNKHTSPWLPLGMLIGTNWGVYIAWNWVPDRKYIELGRANSTYQGILEWEPEQTASADAHQDFMQRHFCASVSNLVNGRLHTLVTAGFSHSDFWHLGGNMFALVLFGYRSCAALGPLPFLGLYVVGSFAASSAHIMLNLYEGKTVPSLSAAEFRCAMRNTLREVDTEMQPKRWALPFIGKRRAAVPSVSSDLAMHSISYTEMLQNNQSKNDASDDGEGDSDDSDIFEKIGKFMAETGMSVISLIRNDETSDNETTGTNEADDHQRPDSDEQGEITPSREEMNKRLDELRRKTESDEDDLRSIKTSWQESLAEEKRRLKSAAEEREYNRQQTALKVATTLVRHRYGGLQDTPSLGASGAVMAITNGSVLLFPLDRVVRSGINLSLPVSAALYTISDIAGIVYKDPTDLVDHAGHLAGAGTGLLYVWLRWNALARAGVACPGVHGALPIVAHWRNLGIRW